MAAKPGSLMVVGTGIKCVGQITLEARGWIEQADRVLYAVLDPVTESWIRQANAHAEDLSIYYGEGKLRRDTYREMT
ncbi:MAG: SAM-dependent methyltransferase, partial [Chloroflexota bacterium]